MARDRIRAFLLDLDDTLLINDMETFSPPYFRALMAKMRGVCQPGTFAEALNAGMRAMSHNDGRGATNSEVFAREFYARIKCLPADVEPLLEDFYRHEFEELAPLTAPDPAARALVSLLLEEGYQVAIATQPVFPLSAIEARLRWAGVGRHEFDYTLVTSYENMSACKPHRAFFEAVLRHLGCRAPEAMMVGDSVQADMPAGRIGLRTFWVDRGRSCRTEPVECDVQGSLADLVTLIETGAINEL